MIYNQSDLDSIPNSCDVYVNIDGIAFLLNELMLMMMLALMVMIILALMG